MNTILELSDEEDTGISNIYNLLIDENNKLIKENKELKDKYINVLTEKENYKSKYDDLKQLYDDLVKSSNKTKEYHLNLIEYYKYNKIKK